MPERLVRACALLASLSIPAFCQTPAANTVVGAGYTSPVPLSLAPGQMVTLFVQGIGRNLTQPVSAASADLPTTLAGVSVTFHQGTDKPVPIFDVRPVVPCFLPAQTGCGTLTAITVQIPFEILPLCPICGRPDIPAQLFVSENGVAGAVVSVTPLADQVHVLTTCDTVVPGAVQRPIGTGLPCPPIVTHGDGSLVSAARPAKPGEQLAIWAVGLGVTNPPVPTGKAAATPTPTAATFWLWFDYSANALPTKPRPIPLLSPGINPFLPLFAGLTPTYVGLYQVNFVVPPPSTAISACSDVTFLLAPGANAVHSNLTVSIGGGFSFDGAGICVTP